MQVGKGPTMSRVILEKGVDMMGIETNFPLGGPLGWAN